MTHISDLRDLIPRLQQASPRVIFFDAMGTLFDLRHSVGDIYAAIATHHQVEVEPAAINEAFFLRLKQPPISFWQYFPMKS